MADRSLVLVTLALLNEVGVPEGQMKRLFFSLSDNEEPTDWSQVEELARHLVRLVTLKRLEGKYQNSKNEAGKRLVSRALKSWANDWYGRTIYDIDSADE